METNGEWIEWIKSETKRKSERVNLKYEIKYDVTFEIDLFFPNIISVYISRARKKCTLVLSYMLTVTTVRTYSISSHTSQGYTKENKKNRPKI